MHGLQGRGGCGHKGKRPCELDIVLPLSLWLADSERNGAEAWGLENEWEVQGELEILLGSERTDQGRQKPTSCAVPS